VAEAGKALNVIPDRGLVRVDVRMTEPAEQARIDREIRDLTAAVPGASLSVRGGPNRSPMPVAAAAALFGAARDAAAELGLAEPGGLPVGGGSDASFAAALGVPVLDGLGGVGGGGHQDDEWLLVDAMPERAALTASLADRIRKGL
jgi:glutamate carboxypeptidase